MFRQAQHDILTLKSGIFDTFLDKYEVNYID